MTVTLPASDLPFEIIHLEGAPKGPPPTKLWPFVWHFVSQIKGLLFVLLALEACVAAGGAMIPVMIGWLVNDIDASAQSRDVLSHPWLWTIAAPVLMGWGACMIVMWFIYDHFYTPRFNNLIRHQLARYTLGHSMAYFSHDFAGRIANKVIEGGAALRDPLRSVISAIWYCGFFCAVVIGTMMHFDLWLAAPVLVWLAAYIASLFYFLPRARKLQLAHNRMHTRLVGHVNDVYANIGIVKLFAREAEETDATLAELEAHGASFRLALNRIWRMGATHTTMNVALLMAAPALALAHWQDGRISSGVAVMVIPMVWQLVNMSGWIRHETTAVFEALARVEECMETIARPWSVVDCSAAAELTVKPGGGEIMFKDIGFDYGGAKLMEGLRLKIPAGQKVGLIGRSGAGKSTLVNLLLRFYDLNSGQILIDGQDISAVRSAACAAHRRGDAGQHPAPPDHRREYLLRPARGPPRRTARRCPARACGKFH